MIDKSVQDPTSIPDNANATGSDESTRRSPAFGVLQRQLIDARDRLVGILTRMHAFNEQALRLVTDTDFITAVGEAIVNIFELEFGICWLLDDAGNIHEPIGILGIQVDSEKLRESGLRLSRLPAQNSPSLALQLTSECLAEIIPGIDINQAIYAVCRDSEGKSLALLLGGNTAYGAGFFEAVTPELRETFGLFAQQTDALLKNRKGRWLINQQMAEIQRSDERLRLALNSNKAGLWDLNLCSKRVDLSSGWATLIGLGPEDSIVEFEEWLDQMPDDDQPLFRTELANLSKGVCNVFELVHRLRHRNGDLLWVLSRGHAIHDSSGLVERVVGTTFDISRQRALEDELQHERSLLRTFIRTIPDLVWLKDREGVYLACNPKFERFFGATEEKIVGKTDYDFVERSLADFFRTHDRAAMAAGGPCVIEEQIRFADDGHHEFVETITTPMFDAKGTLIGVLGIARDITQRRAAEEQIRKLSRSVEQSPSSIVITDLEASIEFVNDAFLEVTGYSRAEVIGKNPRLLQSGATPKTTHEAMWLALTQGMAWQGEFHNKRKDGSEYVEFAIVAPIHQPDGRISHYLAIKEDITEQKRNAEELARHRHHLMDLVEERTLALSIAKEAAEAANRAKSTFLANMSHELRTPMNAIIGIAHLLGRNNSDATQQVKLLKLSNSANILLELLNNILDLSKIDAEYLTLDLTDFTLGNLCDSLESLVADKALSRQIRLDFEIPQALESLGLLGDALRLQQILLNLLSNAIKFTEQGYVHLVVRVERETPDDLLLTFEVSDSGIGIPREALPRIFNPFEQADGSTTRRYGGAGLGLTICQRLIRLMGGEIKVVSSLGKGSTFSFTLLFPKGKKILAHSIQNNV